ncbi:ABC-type branched-subunit amino acid transport system ATPase component [Bradyrhizobium sp. LM3.2]
MSEKVAADTLLEVDGIETCYGLSQVLFGLSLSIKSGEMVSLMGRNGMGKTTTIRSVMGLTPARAGSIRFAGSEVRTQPSYRIAKLGVGLVPEGRQIFPNLTVRENLVAAAADRLWQRQSLDAGVDLRDVSAPRRARLQHGQPALRRRAADARHRPRADDQPEAPDFG